ncbi:MAG: hypothetical protein HY701_13495 [Gemmatimonadetes bacterium]|nr:hypothetical protein [Gemmatimonadota bacterium]
MLKRFRKLRRSTQMAIVAVFVAIAVFGMSGGCIALPVAAVSLAWLRDQPTQLAETRHSVTTRCASAGNEAGPKRPGVRNHALTRMAI